MGAAAKYLNSGEPYHVLPALKGVPPLWPEAKEGDRVMIHNGRLITEYEMKAEGFWYKKSETWVRD